MAHGVVCKKNLDTNDEYFVSLCSEEEGKCIEKRNDPMHSTVFRFSDSLAPR